MTGIVTKKYGAIVSSWGWQADSIFEIDNIIRIILSRKNLQIFYMGFSIQGILPDILQRMKPSSQLIISARMYQE